METVAVGSAKFGSPWDRVFRDFASLEEPETCWEVRIQCVSSEHPSVVMIRLTKAPESTTFPIDAKLNLYIKRDGPAHRYAAPSDEWTIRQRNEWTQKCFPRGIDLALNIERVEVVYPRTINNPPDYNPSELLKSMFVSSRHWDVELVVGGERLKAHRAVLAEASPVFRAMLSSDNLESNSGIILIDALPPTAVKALLHFIYTGATDHADADHDGALQAADYYQVQPLMQYLKSQMLSTLSSNSVCKVARIAYRHGFESLLKDCAKFLRRKAEIPYNWDLLKKEHPDVALRLVDPFIDQSSR